MLTVQVVSDSVVCHIDGRITQTLHKELWVPRDLRTQPVRTRTRPLVQPRQDTLEAVSRLCIVRLHLRYEPIPLESA